MCTVQVDVNAFKSPQRHALNNDEQFPPDEELSEAKFVIYLSSPYPQTSMYIENEKKIHFHL